MTSIETETLSNLNRKKSYILGFILSLILTLAAYSLVSQLLFPNWLTITLILALAIIQLFVQLIFFLHLDKEQKPYWMFAVMLFAALVIIIIVGGSLWIMNNLDYRMMSSPSAINKYMDSQSGL